VRDGLADAARSSGYENVDWGPGRAHRAGFVLDVCLRGSSRLLGR
jgi:hypothetical protein